MRTRASSPCAVEEAVCKTELEEFPRLQDSKLGLKAHCFGVLLKKERCTAWWRAALQATELILTPLFNRLCIRLTPEDQGTPSQTHSHLERQESDQGRSWIYTPDSCLDGRFFSFRRFSRVDYSAGATYSCRVSL